jgi:putative nucleotidyltransferase with HDIG domain
VTADGAEAVARPDLESTAAAIAAHLMEHFASPSYTPPLLPAVAVEVHNLAHRPNVDIKKVVSVLEKDPMLAGRVLKVAQSAMYARRDPPKSLSDAVVRIGMRELSNVLWEVAFTLRVLRVPRYAALTESVVQHSTRCARLTRLVCSAANVQSDYAFLCGLLHDVGTTASLGVLAEHAESSKGPLAGHKVVPDILIAHTLKRCHEEASRRVVSLWKLPEEVQEVVGNHHGGGDAPELWPVAAGLIVAEGLAAEIDGGAWSAVGTESVDPDVVARAQAALRFSDERMATLRDEARALLAVPGGEGPPSVPGTKRPSRGPERALLDMTPAPVPTPPPQPQLPAQRTTTPAQPPRTLTPLQPQPQTQRAKPARKRKWYHFLFR